MQFHASRSASITLSLSIAAALAGCSSSPPQKNGAAVAALTRTTGTPAAPMLMLLRNRSNEEFLVEAKVTGWQSVNATGGPAGHRAIADGVPHVGLPSKTKGGAYEILPLSQLEIAPGAESQWRAGHKVVQSVAASELLLCPADARDPKRGDCLVARAGSWEVQARSGDMQTFNVDSVRLDMLVENCIVIHSAMRDYMGRLSTRKCPDGAGSASLTAGDSARLVSLKAERAAGWAEVKRKEEEKARQEQVAKAEAQKRRIDGIIINSPRGTQLFCESANLVPAGEPINRGSYQCDQFGRNEYVMLNRLLQANWDIVSESRVPQSNMAGGVSYQVSVRLRKM